MAKPKRRRPPRRQMPFPPEATTTDPAEIAKTLDSVDTRAAALLGDDPAVGNNLTSGPSVTPAGFAARGPMPIALFEPPMGVAMVQRDGTTQEMQAEMIIQAGFTRWRMVSVFEHLTDWSVRQTEEGLELWDHGGIWARSAVDLSGEWWEAANEWGVVLAIYGVQLGISNFGADGRPAADRYAILKAGKQAGVVAAALVTWRGLPIPDEAPFEKLTYDPATGQFEIGIGPGNKRSHWRLNTLGEGVHHGLIAGPEGIGKTNGLRLVMLEAICSGRFHVWPADPSGRHDLSWAEQAAHWIARDQAEAMRMLRAAARVIVKRREVGGYEDPSPEKPGILIAIDECQHIFAGNREATKLGELIVTEGGPAGVGLVVTARGTDLAYFGGSVTLRSGLVSGNLAGMGIGGPDLLARAHEVPEWR
jgi:hypothetical protein